MKNSLLSFFSGLLADISKAKSGNEKKEIIYVVGFSTWKTYLRKYFSEYKLIFLPKTISEKNFNYEFKKAILKNKESCQVFIWGFKAPDYILSFLKENEISTKYVEDGFVRSVKLGATKAPPMSLCLDSVTPYFDATKASEFENLLNSYDFKGKDKILEEARVGMEVLCRTGTSKYNNSSFVNIDDFYGAKNKKRILVIGQVEDDASIKYGCEKHISNNDLVKIAVKENPDSQVIYKPHPDVLNGHRPYQSNPRDVENICLVLTKDIPLANSFETIDHVYTITSLAGFEALLRGIKVTTLGCPFYSGWGLTDDRQHNERRNRKLLVEELFALAYLVYPKYFDPETGKNISFFDVVNLINKEINDDKRSSFGSGGLISSDNEMLPLSLKHGICYEGVLDELEKVNKENYLNKKDDLESYLIAKGDYKALIEYYSSAIDKNKYDADLYFNRAKFRVKNGEFTNETAEDFKRSIILSDEFDARYFSYFSFMWEAFPLSENLLNEFKDLLRTKESKAINNKRLANLMILYASMLSEVGKTSEARIFYRKSLIMGAVNKNYMALRYKLWKVEGEKSIAKKDAENFRRVLESSNTFEKMVLEANGSVCVVGNAPTEIGKRNGGRIDNTKLVIRFNSYSTEYPHCEDYGSKVDVWVRMLFHPYVKNDLDKNVKLVIFSGSNRLNRPYAEWNSIFDVMNSGVEVSFFNKNHFYELQNKLGGPPTSGLMMCYSLYKIIGPLHPHHYYGVSFAEDNVESSTYHYSDNSAAAGVRHKWANEKEIFDQICLKKDEPFEGSRSFLYKKNILNDMKKSLDLDSNLLYLFKNRSDIFCTSRVIGDYDFSGKKADFIPPSLLDKENESIKSENNIFIGFGRSKTGIAAIEAAKKFSGKFFLVEYGFISSMHLPSEKQFNFSLVVDDVGIFYDTTKPSRIENILFESKDIFSDYNKKRSRLLIDKICINNITKYNNSADLVLPETKFKKRILVVDQTENDNSILLGQCDNYNFSTMLETALKNHDTEVVLKLHPETIAGAKGGNLTEVEKHKESDNLLVVDKQCNIMSLIKQVDEVYVMTSGVGFEALMLNKPVTCFGVPFYAGWGLTKDMQKVNNPRRSITLEALFSAVFFNYTVFFHPVTEKQCSMEECIDWIIENKPTLPIIKMEK
ncbi:hypothetical protein [Neptunomonas phycophila]|uniref:capsular polysaccharide export protein, LipB/KpsS family n=1 Tax=Neptunomonas phycophila TaxID=1572645 RepID=UPI001BE73825|nr:hypothetical protein [Neptunomonas phycophila]MBT3144317.1 hypothetical protein [Neptunomonas phycophila]